jgi:uncharacterized protein
MRFTRDNVPGVNVIRGYVAGELRINDRTLNGAVLMSSTALDEQPGISTMDQLADSEEVRRLETRIRAMEPELILLGSGPRQVFPPASFGAPFLRDGIGVEVMDTAAASRTFNVLVAEQRRVVALLLV